MNKNVKGQTMDIAVCKRNAFYSQHGSMTLSTPGNRYKPYYGNWFISSKNVGIDQYSNKHYMIAAL